jgi:hypothetical protein
MASRPKVQRRSGGVDASGMASLFEVQRRGQNVRRPACGARIPASPASTTDSAIPAGEPVGPWVTRGWRAGQCELR